jgi:copper chaperone CopZ
MKGITVLFAAMLALGATPALANEAAAPAKAKAAVAKPATTKVVTKSFEITGMMCTACVEKVTAGVKKVKGVQSVKVDLESGKGSITYTEGVADPDKVIKAIEKAGFKGKSAT